jgi:hypothetical protein
MARLRASQQLERELRTNAMVVAQVWRDHPRQASLARLLQAVDVRAVSHQDGRQAGALLATAGTADRSMSPSCFWPRQVTGS